MYTALANSLVSYVTASSLAYGLVMSNHSGSFRLVLKDDHLPYGQLIRAYGNDPVAYRYFGSTSGGNIRLSPTSIHKSLYGSRRTSGGSEHQYN